MYLQGNGVDRIDSYTGPYERWVFSEELGRPFAFPAIAEQKSGHYTALMEGGPLPSMDALDLRLPPLWNPSGNDLRIIPFAFAPKVGSTPHDAPADAALTDALRLLCPQDGGAPAPRFRVNFPVPDDTWVPKYHEGQAPARWQPPVTPPKAIVAVIDDGIPFANRAFLDANGKTPHQPLLAPIRYCRR